MMVNKTGNIGSLESAQHRRNRFAATMKTTISLTTGLVIALVCCMVIFPSETTAQRAAIGIGTKLKQTVFGSGGTTSDGASPSRMKQKNLQGEGNYDNDDYDYGGDSSNGVLLSTLWVIVTERSGIALAMLAALCGYVYLFFHQRQKIDKIEQAIAGGECRVLACLPTSIVLRDETKPNERSVLYFFFFFCYNGFVALTVLRKDKIAVVVLS